MKKGVENGVLTMDDLPPRFVVRCRYSEGIVSETNINLELARNNIWWQDKVDEIKRIMTMQLADLSNSISDFTTNMYRNVKINNKIYKLSYLDQITNYFNQKVYYLIIFFNWE